MTANKNYLAILASVLTLAVPSVSNALVTIFEQDFESGLGANEHIAIDPGEGSDIETRWTSCGTGATQCPFSWTRPAGSSYVRNFDVHHQSTNPYAGGDGHANASDPAVRDMKYNANMSGQVLGHVNANYNYYEDNYYQIDSLDLNANLDDLTLSFEFDSWILEHNAHGFAVSINDGSGWDLLEPTSNSDMQYRDMGTIGDSSLSILSGQDTTPGAPIRGFDGWDGSGAGTDMAGAAIFDIASYAGTTASLRFSFASGGSSAAEGINIDNIKVTGNCISGPSCSPPPPPGVPAPATLALALFGLAFVRKRKRT